MDECRHIPQADGKFNYAPYLNFNQDNSQVNLNAKNVENDNSNYGSGSLRKFARITKTP